MKNICKISFLAMLMMVPFCWLAGYRLNFTPSLPIGLYQIIDGPVHRGQLATFCLEDIYYTNLARERAYLAAGSCSSGLRPLLKVISGVAGDSVELQDGVIVVNGQTLDGTAVVSTDSKGRPTPQSNLKPGIIPPGKVLVLSQHHRGSFDSRYFGLVPLETLRLVRPVIIFK